MFGLFDAPAPAHGALAGLARAGFAAEDIAVLPAHDASHLGAWLAGEATSGAGVADGLRAHGVPAAEAEDIAEAVRRGVVLVAVRCPTVSAAVAAEAIEAAAPTGVDTLRARWAADPALRYGAGAIGSP